MITPRRTRLIRVRDLQAFRDAICDLAYGPGRHARPLFIIVPTAGARRQLRRSMGDAPNGPSSGQPPELLTRDELYDALHARLLHPVPRLSPCERDVIVQAAAREAAASVGFAPSLPTDDGTRRDELDAVAGPPEEAAAPRRVLRPGLVAEMLRFYDQLRRLGQPVSRFEALLEETLERDAPFDRGAERMLQQTRLLAATFRAYERRVADSGACDEHTLRDRLLADPQPSPVRSVIVTVGDWIADPDGLSPADFGLLARLPGLEALDLVATEGTLRSGFHERIYDWLPGLEEVEAARTPAPARPALVVPAATPAQPFFVSRDREEELIDIARRLNDRTDQNADPGGARVLDRMAIVYRRPLPYVYVAREVFGDAGLPYQTVDAPPLAAEPFAAALDLVLDFVAGSFTRATLVALLRSPHVRLGAEGDLIDRHAVAALDRSLSDARYLGGLDHLERLAAATPGNGLPSDCRTALLAALRAAQELSPLRSTAPLSAQIGRLLSFLGTHDANAGSGVAPSPAEPVAAEATRERRASATIVRLLEDLAAASRAHDDSPADVHSLRSMIHRAIEGQTFVPDPRAPEAGLHLLDEQAARYGDFDEMTLVGLIEDEWPQRPRRNIFYSASLLRALGWPSERDWLAAAEARFVDLLASPVKGVRLSTISLEDDALVEPSPLLDEVPRAGLAVLVREAPQAERLSVDEALSIDPVALDRLEPRTRAWAELRLARSDPAHASFHGQTSALPVRPWSVSAIETYLECPFKFFARHILRLEDEPVDEESMDPRRQGAFVHKVFERFFREWQARGGRRVTAQNLDAVRSVFKEVVEQSLRELPTAEEAALERTRLLGSPGAAGLGEAVFRMEAERPIDVVDRLIEAPLDGEFAFQTASGSRAIALKGKADRIDLLADGTFRLIDYKLGWPPTRTRALQLPIYGLCAEQRLRGYHGRHWTLGEAAYLAFKGPKRVIPLISTIERDRVLVDAQERLVEAVDRIASGEFPPRPDDVHLCETCSYSAVCRKDYIDEV